MFSNYQIHSIYLILAVKLKSANNILSFSYVFWSSAHLLVGVHKFHEFPFFACTHAKANLFYNRGHERTFGFPHPPEDAR